MTPAKKTVNDPAVDLPIVFTVKAKPGYNATTAPTVGGTCAAGTMGTWANGATTYTLNTVTEACSVTFAFTKAPMVVAGSATNITQSEATLNARVNPENAQTGLS